MALFKRLWSFIRRPTGYVGRDLEGNYFYEHASTSGGDWRRTRRVVKYMGQTDTLAVANRSRQLSVQWKAWLTHTRLHPPTLEELQADTARMERLRHNVALIEARDREERLRISAGAVTESHVGYERELGVRQGAPTTGSFPPAQKGSAEVNRSAATSDGTRPPKEDTSASQHSGDSADVTCNVMTENDIQEHRLIEEQCGHDPWVRRPVPEEPQAWTPRTAQRGA